VYYDDILTASINDGNNYWRVTNKDPELIETVDIYHSGGGSIGAFEILSGNPDVTNYGGGPLHYDYSSFDMGDSTALFSGSDWLDYVICHFADNTTSNAGTPFGKALNPPDKPQGSGASCATFVITLPIHLVDFLNLGWGDWVFNIPNYLCEFRNWLVQLFAIDTSVVATNYTVWIDTFNSKAPMAYAVAFQDAIPNIGSPSGVANLPDVAYNYDIPMNINGSWTYTPFITGTFEFAPYAQLQTQITQFRTAIAVLLWVIVFGYIFFRVTNL
jgi:hypothetical protein